MNGTMNEMMTPVVQSAINTITTKRSSCEATEPALVSEDCKVSNFSLAAFAGSVLLCLGIVVYALLSI